MAKTQRGKGTTLMIIANASGLPFAVHTSSVSVYFVTFVDADATLSETVTLARLGRFIKGRACDGDRLEQILFAQDIELIASRKSNRKRAVAHDECALASLQTAMQD